MPWQEASTVSLRLEFIQLASAEPANLAQLCRRFHISRPTAYKWLARYQAQGSEGLTDCSRRPHSSPTRTGPELEQLVLELRQQHPAWGARKLHARLLALGHNDLPSVTTLNNILRRHQAIDPQEAVKHQAWHRFEHAVPNELWQMDFKGDFALQQQQQRQPPTHSAARCYPLTVLDDHSRFALGLQALGNQTTQAVQAELTRLFRRYGLPQRMTMDNGSPWGWGAAEGHPYTPLTVWLLRLGIRVSHSRPYHPQTQGKDERFHRTFKAEVLAYQHFESLEQAGASFEQWRHCYNHERPHQALQMAVPASRYQLSSREFPEQLPPIEYGPDDIVRQVKDRGRIKYGNQLYKIPKAFYGYPVALRPTLQDGRLAVYFCQYKVAEIDLQSKQQEL